MEPYRFTVEVYPDKEEGGYTALVPSLPGCVTQGETLDQTLERVREAIAGYIECLKADGKAIPRGWPTHLDGWAPSSPPCGVRLTKP